MSYAVHIHVVFECYGGHALAELAAAHLRTIPSEDRDGQREARWFLEALAGRGSRRGGGLVLWGMVGDWTDAEAFCEVLMPFWEGLLDGGHDDLPCGWDHVLVFDQRENEARTTVREIGRARSDDPVLVRVVPDLPFSLGHH